VSELMTLENLVVSLVVKLKFDLPQKRCNLGIQLFLRSVVVQVLEIVRKRMLNEGLNQDTAHYVPSK
jgi:hypothetical protein